jgi:penicillin-binding protein 2
MTTHSAGIQSDKGRLRMAVVLGVMMLGLAYLTGCLYKIQVKHSTLYSDAQDDYSFRRVRQPAPRGKILDRNGAVLADNKPSYSVAIYIEELRQRGAWSNTINHVDTILDNISVITGKERDIDRDGIWAHIQRRRPIPLFAFEGLDDIQLARLAEYPGPLPGTDIYVQAKRSYPMGDLASHIIGYVGSGLPREVQEEGEEPSSDKDYYYNLPDMAGREGIELACDSQLAGRGGGHLIRVNAVGYKHEIIPGKPPVPGSDVILTLDAHLQRVAEEALGQNRGAAVVIDCTNGDILAIASSPRFDLGDFVPRLSPEKWKSLLRNPNKPLYNRALNGVYMPGSVFKPVVALGALREKVINEHEHYNCTGFIKIGGRTFRCAQRYGHGQLEMRRAIAASCNPYFIEIAQRMGYEPAIYEDALQLGFGRAPQIGIPASSGLLGSTKWKKARHKDSWRAGDTANVAMGQGFITASPLQVAIMATAIALDGKVIKPRLIRDAGDGTGIRDELVISDVMDWSNHDLAVVKGGMYDAVVKPYGTARRSKIPGVSAGAKTGTAEYYEGGERKKLAWMISFAPFENPAYTVTVVAEDSDAGGQTAAAILRKIYKELFAEEIAEAVESGEIYIEDYHHDEEDHEAVEEQVPGSAVEEMGETWDDAQSFEEAEE